MPPTIEVLQPTSPDEAVAAFGDGDGVTVVAGGTIVLPDLTHGRLHPQRAIMLGAAGLDGSGREDGALRYGATTPVAALDDAPEPLRRAAAHVADREIRAVGTIGGNLCAGQSASATAPRGDLQAPLIALGATVRSAGAGGERSEPVEDFLSGSGGRLVLSIDIPDAPRRSGYARLDRPHAHHYTILAVSVVAPPDGLEGVRVAVSGAGPRAVRCPSVERALATGEPDAAERVLDDVEVADDALASAWYRKRVLPTLVSRAIDDLQGE